MDFFKKTEHSPREECISFPLSDHPEYGLPGRLDLQIWEVGYAGEQTHWHLRPFAEDPYYRCYFLTDGRGKLQLLEETFAMQAGGLYLIPPNLLFKYSLEEAPPAHYWIHFSSDLLDGLPSFRQPREIQADVRAEMEQLLRLAGSGPSPQAALDMDILVRSILHHFFLQNAEDCEPRIHSGAIAESIDYIKRNYRHDIPMPELAARVNMDCNNFSREFRRAVGVSPKHYLVQTRINRARILLLGTTLSTREIAREAGYLDEFYFYRIFRKRVRMSPTAYRKLNSALR